MKKDAKQLLADSEELIRRKNIENNELRHEIKRLYRENDSAEAILNVIWGISEHQPNPPQWLSGRGSSLGHSGVPITMWSDWHYGEIVNGEEINFQNRYNIQIAKQRITRLYDTVVDISYNHMGKADTNYPGIIVCLGGDMISGDIHEELSITNEQTSMESVEDLIDLLAAGIDHMAVKFGKVYVPCVVGNHGRTTKKPPRKKLVFQNYDFSIYAALKRHFKKDAKHIQIDIALGSDISFKSYGTRFMFSHGDNLGVKGGDGIIGAIGPITRGTIKVANQYSQMGGDFDYLLLCHWHQMLWLPNAIVNNALKGPDEYSMVALRAPAKRPSQALFFNHPEHEITARWELFLEKKVRAAEAEVWASWQDSSTRRPPQS